MIVKRRACTMGATVWHHFTPHRDDPEDALQQLRADVFARGDYVDVTGPLKEVLQHTAKRFGQDPDSPEVSAEIDHSVRIQRAIETGDLRGLSRADQALVKRVRAFGALAGSLGVEPPLPSSRRPRSIDELLERAAECGTHSVVDIEHVAARPAVGVAAPMTAVSLRQAFGTAEPTHEQVDAGWADIAERLPRWHARYLVVHLNGRPHEYVFIGCSGD